MSRLCDPSYYSGDLGFFGDAGASARNRVAHFSRDGKKFVICLRRGNIEQNTNEFTLLLYRTDEVFQSPVPEVLLTISSSSNLGAMQDIVWLADNETLAFLGVRSGKFRQVYTYNIRSHALAKVTNHPTNVASFSISSGGHKVAYTAQRPEEGIWDEQARRHGVIVSNQLILDLIEGHTEPYSSGQLFFKAGDDTGHLMEPKMSFWGPPFLSPDGKYIVIASQPTYVPPDWREYSDSLLRRRAQQELSPGEHSSLRRYSLIDTHTGDSQILLNSPIDVMRGQEVVWSPDSRSVAISGVYLPLGNTDGIERKTRQSSVFTVEVEVPNGEFAKVRQGDSQVEAWDKETNRLIVLGRKDAPGQTFIHHKKDGIWKQVDDHTPGRVRPQIVLEEDMNHPPKIYAVAPSNHRKALLLDLNPQFKTLTFANEEEIRWKGSGGHDVKGGLYYPLDYVPGKRYPLVIQTHGFLPDKFGIDGAYVSPFAAQPLAVKGIMVLQADEDYGRMDETPGEVDRELARMEGAIDYLDRRGLIDPDRVGVVGFSRTCLYVKYALTHSKYRFTAASVMDGVDGGYLQYILFAPGTRAFYEGINGGAPFGRGVKTWLQRSPGFNTDNVQTPLRIIAANRASLLGEWEWFAALSLQSRPVELVYLRDATHIMEKPWDRVVAQQGNVDWFVFWLKGEEDPDPTKFKQYARWRELRKLQERNGRKLPPN